MRILALDTSTRVASVAVVDGDRVLARATSDDPAHHAEAIVPLVDRAVAASGVAKGAIEAVACGLGPGSFTGVRVALATAKGIALGLGVPIVGLGTLELLAAGLPEAEPAAVALIDARKAEVFWAPCTRAGELLAEPACTARPLVGPAIAAWIARGLPVVGEIAPELDLPGARVLRSAATDLPDAASAARLAAARLAAGAADDLDALEPRYVRPPDVTLPLGSPQGRPLPPSV